MSKFTLLCQSNFFSTVSYYISVNERGDTKNVMILKMMNLCRLQDLKTLIVLKLGYRGKLFHSLFKVYILMYFKCFRGRSIRLRTNSMLKKRFFSFKNFHSSTVVCTMMLLPSKLSKFNNVEHSFR